ncbi:hypothetical protein [Pseudaquabacterium terrae]|nr:hypothetical protein [Aquabacterium terrae]
MDKIPDGEHIHPMRAHIEPRCDADRSCDLAPHARPDLMPFGI